MKTKLIAGTVGAVVLLILLILVVWLVPGRSTEHSHSATTTTAVSTTYSCPMHPQIRQPEFGQCPLCGMDLVPIADDAAGEEGESELPVLQVSRRAAALMDLQTAVVERRAVEVERRFLGMFGYDETRLHDITLRTEGQLERLFVNYTGIPVRKGEHIAEIYSPEFYAAARDLLIARSAKDPVALEGARRKLHLLNVNEPQITAIVESGSAPEIFTLFSPVAGVITLLDGRQGSWMMKGQRIAQVADTTSLWVLLDAYESDIALIHYGQQVKLEVPAFPGLPVTGFVAYVAPDLNERTRTIKVRLNVPNPGGRLRPGMFAHALLKVPLTATGEAYGPELADKYICPMHPEITGTEAQPCTICGMPLEPAAVLDPTHVRNEVALPMVIPATAPLITGKRAVIYVQLPDRERPTFEGRTITLGPRAGEYYLVLEGLEEGERVVTHGNFKIDSELQIRGRASMMSPSKESIDGHIPGFSEKSATTTQPTPLEIPAEFGAGLRVLVEDYLRLVEQLAAGDATEANASATAMEAHFQEVAVDDLSDEATRAWESIASGLSAALGQMNRDGTIDVLREQLVPLTAGLRSAVLRFGAGHVGPLYVAHCPMAFQNRGADWLQAEEEIANPYYGSRMLRCGDITGTIP